jgi:hypothetical protein
LDQSAQSFKLQSAEKSGTCSASAFGDLTPNGSTAFKLPTTAFEDNTSGDTAWSLPGVSALTQADSNNTGIDSSVATTYSHTAKLTGYGFNIPANATPTGLEVTAPYQVFTDGGYLPRITVYPVVAGAYAGASDFRNLNSGLGTTTIGGSTSLFGLTTLTATQVNASDFGFAVSLSAPYDGILGAGTSISIDSLSLKVYYTSPSNILYYNNATPADGAAISSTGSDPSNGGRTAVYQSYRETDPFTDDVAAIPLGQDGIWDFALTTTSAVAGKTYCFRVVKSNGAVLDSYSQYPEITFSGGGGGGPTPTAQKLRGGRSIQNGVKSGFEL